MAVSIIVTIIITVTVTVTVTVNLTGHPQTCYTPLDYNIQTKVKIANITTK